MTELQITRITLSPVQRSQPVRPWVIRSESDGLPPGPSLSSLTVVSPAALTPWDTACPTVTLATRAAPAKPFLSSCPAVTPQHDGKGELVPCNGVKGAEEIYIYTYMYILYILDIWWCAANMPFGFFSSFLVWLVFCCRAWLLFFFVFF